MRIVKITFGNKNYAIEEALRVIKQGSLVIYPTETCYGLGADVTNQQAVDNLLRFKRRREGKAFSVAVADQAMAEEYVELNETARNLYRNFLPGPLTVVSKVKSSKLKIKSSSQLSNVKGQMLSIAKGVVSEFNTLGIRISDHLMPMALVKALGRPITATSANVSYQAPPYSVTQWQMQTPKKSQAMVDLWLDDGILPQRPTSTVVDTTVDELTVLRQGNLVFDKAILEIVTRSEEETCRLAERIIKNQESRIRNQGLVIGLQGELGAGKTQFAKGIARALGIKEPVRSPTFTLVHEYKFGRTPPNPLFSKEGGRGEFSFYHIDTWRMEREEELSQIGFEQMLKPGNVIVIEWVEKVAELVRAVGTRHGVFLLWGTIEVINDHTRKWQFAEKLG